jgi:hypothetical protein
MLPMMPSPHPMARHRRAATLPLLPLQGTLEVAARLGYLKLHPWIRAANKDTGVAMTQPFPWIGDLLFFRSDEHGPFAVNVTVKADPADFNSPYRGELMGCGSAVRAREKSVARHAIEHQLYADAGIRTVRATRKDVDPMVGHNLCRILGVRISAIVDACFSLIVDGVSARSRTRRGCAQAMVRMYLSRPRSA